MSFVSIEGGLALASFPQIPTGSLLYLFFFFVFVRLDFLVLEIREDDEDVEEDE